MKLKQNDEKLIQDWKNKIHDTFGDRNNLYRYLFETLDNFYFRYLETTLSKDLKTAELGPGVFGAVSFESMLVALKDPHADAKAGIISQAKIDRNSIIRMGLWVELKDLSQDYGKMKFVSEINWGFPDYQNPAQRLQKTVDFEYDDFQVFRKKLALKLEEVSELF
jgi:hypothetical protein